MREYIPDGYGLSRYRIRELYAFCRQYGEYTCESEKRLIIERIALEAADGNDIMCKALLRNVTEGVPFVSIDVPCSVATFSRMRRHFFYLLDKET